MEVKIFLFLRIFFLVYGLLEKRNVRIVFSVVRNVVINLKKDYKNNIFILFVRIEGVECSLS